MAKRHRDDDRDFEDTFEPGPVDVLPPSKYKHVDESQTTAQLPVIECALAPHPAPIPFFSHEEYEIHYQRFHANRCTACHVTLPSEHYLDLHLAENHDPIEDSRRGRGDKTYRCFVEGCDKICATPQKRRMHLVDKHQFPRNFDFFIVNNGIDRRNSMLRPDWPSKRNSHASNLRPKGNLDFRKDQSGSAEGPRRKNTSVATPKNIASNSVHGGQVKSPEADGAVDDEAMEGLTSALSAIQFVPRNVVLGHKGKAYSRE